MSERRRRQEEEGESAFVSMTDLTVSFLFIILVLLAFFATQFRPEDTVSQNEYDMLAIDLSEARNEVRRLGKMLADKDREIAALRNSEAGLQGELVTGRERAASLAADADLLKQAVSDLELRSGRLLARIEELKTPDTLADYLEKASSTRTVLLENLAERIRRRLPGVRVTVVAADGIIRFRGDDLFESGQWRVRPGSTAERVSRAVGDVLADTLPCYTVGSRAAFEEGCNGGYAAIETIQIEGHTDDVPLSRTLRDRERMLDNRDLSARRGAETLRAATDRYRPELMTFLNFHGQPVLSFAGYGAMRPIDRGDSAEARAVNRRIDLRFILQTPQNLGEIEEIRDRLAQKRPSLLPIVKERVR